MKSEEKCTVTHSLWKNGHLLLSQQARSPSAHTMCTMMWVWVYSHKFMFVVHVVHVCACTQMHTFVYVCACMYEWMCVHTCVYSYMGDVCVHVYTYFTVKIICFPYLRHILSSSWRNINSSLNRKQIRFKIKERKPFSGSAVFLISARTLLYMWWYLLNASN